MEQKATVERRAPQIIATLVVTGDTMQKIRGLQNVEYAVLITPTLHGFGNRITGMAVTCHNERRAFSMPVEVFNEVQITQHAV